MAPEKAKTQERDSHMTRKGKRGYNYYATYSIHGFTKNFTDETIRGMAKQLGINHITAMKYCQMEGKPLPAGRLPLTIYKVEKK